MWGIVLSKALLSCLLVCSLTSLTVAQSGGGHVGNVVPKGARSVECSGKPIPHLEDVAEKAGITFKHEFVPEKRYITESMGGGVVLIDYDRDGWPDIYFSNNPSVENQLKGLHAWGALYHNNHDGTFTDITGKAGLKTPCYGMGGSVGDYNNDGWPDLYLTCLGGNILYRNNGDGTFTDVTAKAGIKDGRWSTGSAFGDYDGDGYVDLVVSNYLDFHLNDLPGFGKQATCKYRGLDVQCGPRGMPGAGDSLFHNNGDGTFTDVSKQTGADDPNGYYGLGVSWADFGNVGRSDVYMANDATPNFLYRNEGAGKLNELGMESGTALTDDGVGQGSMGIAFGDYNHTGRLSIFVTNYAEQYSTLYRNEGDWNFRDVSYESGVAVSSLPYVKWGTAFIDFDNDGWLDLITVSGHVYPQADQLTIGARYREPSVLNINQHDGTFCDASKQAGPTILELRAGRGVAIGDLFNTGQMDVVIEDLDQRPSILRNPGIAGNHWISFELQGTKSNRLALGARVTITTSSPDGKMTQMDEVRSGGSYLSQNDLRLHFGLGKATKIESVEVRWPSGAKESLPATELAFDKYYSVLEGKGLVSAEQIGPSKPRP